MVLLERRPTACLRRPRSPSRKRRDHGATENNDVIPAAMAMSTKVFETKGKKKLRSCTGCSVSKGCTGRYSNSAAYVATIILHGLCGCQRSQDYAEQEEHTVCRDRARRLHALKIGVSHRWTGSSPYRMVPTRHKQSVRIKAMKWSKC